MQRLDLDFRAPRRTSPWPGRLLFVVAAAFATDVGLSYRSVQHALEANEARLARAPRAAHARKVSAAEIAAARETVERIALPWDRLFAALESAASEQIALLGVEPDPAKGTVLISGEGKDYLAALSYVLNLRREPVLSRVQLVRHEAKGEDAQGPVSFAVSASWGEAAR